LFKHGKDQIVRRVSAFYGMIGPKLSQIEREKMNVVNHFSGFIEALAKGVENNASKPPDLAIFRVRRTIQSLNNLAMLYVEVTSLSIECLNS
jgi:hypothetical protein